MKTYTTQEVANIFHCDIQTIRRYIKSGKLETLKFGRGYKITQEQLDMFIKTRKYKEKL